ncbi:MAG: hypothetical protein KGZ61_01770 [Sandarakinorhabdus sp.]|nr:hypothetical protein [Sandarakinorhabdus sp.]
MTEPDPALRKLWLMTLVRLTGVALAILGLWIAGRQPFGEASVVPALLVMASGAVLVIFAPRLFRK